MHKEDLIDWERLANNLLDRACEMESPNELASWLLAIGYNTEELIILGFDRDAVERIDADYRRKGAW